MKNKKVTRFFKRLNPRNLASEVHVYGYNFSWKTHLLILICSLFAIAAIGILFKLKPIYFTELVIAVCAMLPALIISSYKRMFEQKRFSDVVTYAEQILYSFQKNGKIVSALKETCEIFEEGRMRWAIEDAIEYLEKGVSHSEKGMLREALEIIENGYACIKLHMVHELLVSSEEYGGEVQESILLVLNDIELWKRRGYKLQADKKRSHTDNVVSIAVATILCSSILYIINYMGEMYSMAERVDFFSIEIIQISSFIFILFLLYVFAKSMDSLTSNWLQDEGLLEETYILSSYDTVMNYDDMKERKKSIIFAAPFLVISVVMFYLGNIWVSVGSLLLAAFMLIQHKIGYNMAKKDVNDELYIELPQWLMEMALLLQNNNVQVSITKSIQEAPPLLKRELFTLMERLQETPDRLYSYTDFCKKFDVPEVQSTMKMLHAISENGTGNATIQINNLIQRVHEMQNIADNIRNKNISFKMKMIFTYPVLAATIKLLVDMTIGMLFMFQMIGSIGGV